MIVPTEADFDPRLNFQPGRLWSLWKMKDWDGPQLARAIGVLSGANQMWFTFKGSNQAVLTASHRAALVTSCKYIIKLADEQDFDVLADFSRELLSTVERLPSPKADAPAPLDKAQLDRLQPLVDRVLKTFESTLKGRSSFVLSRNGQQLYAPKEPLFGKEVFDKFQKSQRDIDEAGKCIAFRRNKAAVFHLMLAMEEALRALAVKIGAEVYDTKKDQFHPWGQIVGNVKGQIPALPRDQQDGWTEVHNLLWGVNKSWRNGTMHPAESYSDEEAEAIYGAVKSFMRYLAPLV